MLPLILLNEIIEVLVVYELDYLRKNELIFIHSSLINITKEYSNPLTPKDTYNKLNFNYFKKNFYDFLVDTNACKL